MYNIFSCHKAYGLIQTHLTMFGYSHLLQYAAYFHLYAISLHICAYFKHTYIDSNLLIELQILVILLIMFCNLFLSASVREKSYILGGYISVIII